MCQKSVGKNKLYHCNQWNCQFCLARKLHWLREQSVNFAHLLAFQKTWFIVLKGFQNAQEASDTVKWIIEREKSLKTPCGTKLEYFYVIANHNHSGWHVHLMVNRKLSGHAAYCEPVQSRKATCLYFVGNLGRSAHQDYGRVRRYGASALLHKQSMKNWYKLRIKRWSLIVTLALVTIMINWLSSWLAPLPYRTVLGYAPITQPLRYHRGITEEFSFRKPRDDLIGEGERR